MTHPSQRQNNFPHLARLHRALPEKGTVVANIIIVIIRATIANTHHRGARLQKALPEQGVSMLEIVRSNL